MFVIHFQLLEHHVDTVLSCTGRTCCKMQPSSHCCRNDHPFTHAHTHTHTHTHTPELHFSCQ